jgi:hypothetical protein
MTFRTGRRRTRDWSPENPITNKYDLTISLRSSLRIQCDADTRNEWTTGAFSLNSRIDDPALSLRLQQIVGLPPTGIRDTLQLFRGAP